MTFISRFLSCSTFRPAFLILILLALPLLTACGGTATTESATLPSGDAASGAALFVQQISGAPACNSCHTVDGTKSTGPTLQGYAARAGAQVAGQDAITYTVSSITHPAAFTVSGYANLMYNQYRQLLSPQQLADLVAYLLTL